MRCWKTCFLNCFSYPSEDQEIYDEERQVQRVHVNSNAEEGSQYQTYSQNCEIATSSGKQLDRSLTFKKRGRPKKNEDDDVEWSQTATNLVTDFWQVQEILYNAKHQKYHIREENSRALSILQAICLNKVMSLQQPRYPANVFLWKTTFAKKGEKLRQPLRKAVAERINFIKVNGDFMSA